MHNRTIVTFFFAAAVLGSEACSQAVSSSAVVDWELRSSGYNCISQNSWNQTVPLGPLAAGVTSLTNFDWTLGASSLSFTSSGVGASCGFYSPPTGFSNRGSVIVTLVSPIATVVEVTVTGSATGPTGGSGPISLGSSSSSVEIDGALFASLTPGGGSVNQTTQVVVGPAGVELDVFHLSGTGQSLLSQSVSTQLTVSWTPLVAASVSTVPGGCAASTATPLFVETGLPLLGGSIEADLLQAQGPSPLGFVMFGLESAAIPLDGIGMPGCTALQTEFISLVAQPTGANELHLSVPIPNQPWLIGVQLYSQGFTQALGVNARELLASNGLVWRIGT